MTIENSKMVAKGKKEESNSLESTQGNFLGWWKVYLDCGKNYTNVLICPKW